MSNRKKIIIGIMVILVVAALVIVNLKQSAGKTFKVQTEKVTRGKLVHLVSGTGRIQPEVAVRISAHVRGKIIKLHAIEGEKVKKGKLLVELDRTRYEAAVVQAKASLSSARATARQQKANLDQALSEQKRTQKLFEQGLSSQEVLENSKTKSEVARARYEASQDQVTQSQAYLDQADDDLEKTRIHSPIDGVVTQLNKEEGEMALGSEFQEDVIMVVSDLSDMEAVVEVDENDVVNVAIGDSARIRVDAFPDTVFIGKVTEIAHSAKTKGLGTQEEVINFEVKVAVLEDIKNIRPGMSANVDIVTDVLDDVLKIPIQAVTVRTNKEIDNALHPKRKRGKAMSDSSNDVSASAAKKSKRDEFQQVVFVVEDGAAKIRRIKTGIIGETDIEVLRGLDEGETIVTGSYRVLSKELKHNAHVKIEKSRKFQSRNESE